MSFVPDIILHVPREFVTWEAMEEPDQRQVLAGMHFVLVQLPICVMHVGLIKIERDWSKFGWHAVAELLGRVIWRRVRSCRNLHQ